MSERFRTKALSYVCGKEVAGSPLHCNGSPLAIHSSLYNALTYARKRHEHDMIWADAICIDQWNPVEKTHQVTMMRDIFFNAEAGMVWLGRRSRKRRQTSFRSA